LVRASLALTSCNKDELPVPKSTEIENEDAATASEAAPANTSAYQASYFYTYEGSLQTWSKDATDLELGDGEIEWSIIPKTTFPYQGSYSLEYYLNNMNDAGKIWVEKSFSVPANRTYKVDVSYKLASNDWGDVNNFAILTGASTTNPEVAADVVPQGDTYNGGTHNYVWLNKSYSFNVTANSLGKIWVHVGVWGTWETPRTYYYDNVSITITQL
jgi:hypothetical protein